MNDSADSNVADQDKPVSPSQSGVDIFPPIPEPTEADFDDDIEKEEQEYYKLKYIDVNDIKNERLHCTSCDRHLGCLVSKSNKVKMHPMLRTLVCNTCHTFYNSGEFEKGDDGSELYCRWCGQGGQVYCCSDCPHVFCAKCIKRNLGVSKIKEIENTDDWKCFKCTPRCLWDLRALCWATFHYYDFKNKIIDSTTNEELKEKYLKAVENDESKCCREKRKRQSGAGRRAEPAKKKDEPKKTESEKPPMLKFPSTIQVKKFASINASETDGVKKYNKRPASPKAKMNYMAKPIAIAPYAAPRAPPAKRMRGPIPNMIRQVGPVEKRTFIGFTPRMIRPNPQISIPFSMMDRSTNGYNNYVTDNLNLSIENLTQGLDMGAVAAMAAGDDLVCTPDFPLEHLEPLCEVNEDNTDDDVECISPAPQATITKSTNTGTSKPPNKKRKFNDDNIIQMTENDVTVNALTGGLKFRVDPQTLSSNKMYRLPDGRIFAINPNPNMPGGYSATIVAVTENNTTNVSKGATYAAKVSAVTSLSNNNPPPLSKLKRINLVAKPDRRPTPASPVATKSKDETLKKCDLKVPVEWYRFNLVDAVDALEYSLMRLKKLKKDATTSFLRTRTVQETRSLHSILDRLLNTSESRFSEIRQNLNKGFKQYLRQKQRNSGSVLESDDEGEDDDDDVEILPNDHDDDPIFIDENSVDSVKETTENQEVDLVSSDLNDSEERNTISCQKDPLEKSDSNNHDLDKPNNRNDSIEDNTLNDVSEPKQNNQDKDDTDNANQPNNSSKMIEGKDDSCNDVKMSETVRDTNKENKLSSEEDKIESSNEESQSDKKKLHDDSPSCNEKKSVEDDCEPENSDLPDADADGNAIKDVSEFEDGESKTADDKMDSANDECETVGEGNTANESKITVDESNLGEDDSKTGDVEMSADIIDSLLNDDGDVQDAQNDDNKSIGSEEFII